MKILYIILISFLLPFALMAQSSSIEGEWSPDSQCWLGEIRIKQSGENEYKIRMNTSKGVKVVSATFDKGVLYGKFEDKSPEYGEFWVGNGPIEKGEKKEILVGDSGYSYTSNGAVNGWMGDNVNYRLTNSRQNCADVEKSYCKLRLEINGDDMTVYFLLRSEYLKDGQPMFYQESGWIKGFQYTRW